MTEETTRNAITTPAAMAATLNQRIRASSLEKEPEFDTRRGTQPGGLQADTCLRSGGPGESHYPRRSQNRAEASRLTRLPSSSHQV